MKCAQSWETWQKRDRTSKSWFSLSQSSSNLFEDYSVVNFWSWIQEHESRYERFTLGTEIYCGIWPNTHACKPGQWNNQQWCLFVNCLPVEQKLLFILLNSHLAVYDRFNQACSLHFWHQIRRLFFSTIQWWCLYPGGHTVSDVKLMCMCCVTGHGLLEVRSLTSVWNCSFSTVTVSKPRRGWLLVKPRSRTVSMDLETVLRHCWKSMRTLTELLLHKRKRSLRSMDSLIRYVHVMLWLWYR